MKVIVAVLFAIGTASALGSGPYLPSGWKPKGPAFYLPSEIQKPADNPLKETLLFETEASGSEGLREYGPPKVESSAQALPDVATEQTFYVVDSSAFEQQQAEINVEQKAEFVQEATTEAEATKAEIKIQDFELNEVSTPAYDVIIGKLEAVDQEVVSEQAEAVTDVVDVVTDEVDVVTDIVEAEVVTDKAAVLEVVAEVKEVEAVVAATEEKLENIVAEEEKLENIVVQQEAEIEKAVSTVASVRNIAEALVNIENEIKAEQEVQNIETVGELKVTQNESGLEQVPEGFLEYGPPGFREYGPPKGDELLSAITENEIRRRRFSPKFGSSKTKKH